MSIYGASELARSFRTVRKNTIITAQEIPEEQYGFRATPDTRSVAETLVHMAVIPTFGERIHFNDKIDTFVGFDFFGVMGAHYAEEKVPRTKAEIIEMLTVNGERFAQLLDGVTDEVLAETITYPPGMEPAFKTRFEMLLSTKEHEMHHRGQLMLMQRMIGIVPHLTRHFQARVAEIQAARK
ncbi:DinB family protein [Paludibaculum fermentans]|uniref:DinB family protein n=1 Tax=Paludibaculum fermentans TaxID=1473598 RepID=UPI003EBB5DF3